MNNNDIKTPEQIAHEALQKQIALEELAQRNCILRVVAGSHAYGTNIEGSDWDERGIFTDEMSRIALPFDKIEQVQLRQDDIVVYELSKYMPLLLSQNPNVIELIWTEDSDVQFQNDMGKLLRDNRKHFLSKEIKESYVGYAESQLKRIKGHNKWLNNPQAEKAPQMKDFSSVVWNNTGDKAYNRKVPFEGFVGLDLGDSHYSLWHHAKLGVDNKSWVDNKGNPIPLTKQEMVKINPEHIAPDLIVKINRKAYEDGFKNWKTYWQWKANRNEKRSVLEEKYGYDVKHAMHLIRLLRSGLDILQYGVVPVKRPDREYLLDIRSGKYTYEEILAQSEELTRKVEEVSKKSSLPAEPDRALAKEIMLHIYQQQWGLSPRETNQLMMRKISL